MSTQPVQAPVSGEVPPSNLGFSLKSCPTCGQEIPPDKIEEVGGRIAARERERTLAITAEIDKRYADEKKRADAAAKASLELERQQSVIREARARDEAQQAAERQFNQQLVEVEQRHAALLTDFQAQLDAAAAVSKADEEMCTQLRAEIEDVQAKGAEALETTRAEARRREEEIREEAKRTAELTTSQAVAAMETSQRAIQDKLSERLTESEAARIAAEQDTGRMLSELEATRNSNTAELDRVKQKAADDLAAAQRTTTEEVEARFRDNLKANETALAEANAKVLEAQTELSTVREQQAAMMEENLKAQREVMERDKVDAVNAERSRAFDEKQKLSDRLTELQRAWDKKTAEELGEGAEVNLYEALKKEFRGDDIRRVPKGVEGADIIHVVMHSGKKCGTIIYDSKDRNKFEWAYVTKLRADQLAEHAEHAILSTRKLPKDTRQIHIHGGVLIANPARVVILATLIRQHILQLHIQKVGDIERKAKTAALYDFIISERCRSLLARIDERADEMLKEQEKEVTWHRNHWKREGEALRAIQKAKADLETQVDRIIGTSADDESD